MTELSQKPSPQDAAPNTGGVAAPGAVAVVSGVLLTGVALQLTLGRGVPAPAYPAAPLLLALFVVKLGILGTAFRRSPLVAAAAGIPFTLACFAGLGLLAAAAGTLPQGRAPDPEAWSARLGLYAVTSSWPFVLTLLLLLANLGLALMRRLIPWTPASARFALGHLGVWIALAAGAFGSGSIERVRIEVREGAAVVHGTSASGERRELPFGLRLMDFRLEEYPPALTHLDVETGEMLWKKGDPRIEAVSGARGQLGEISVEVLETVARAVARPDGGYSPSGNPDAPYAALLRLRDATGATEKTGWAVAATADSVPKSVVIDGVAVTLAKPRPKNFLSEVVLFTPAGESEPATIEMNAPAHIAGWRVYQLSYDEKRGPGSDLSVFEAVRDPWLPAVYAGIFILIAGGVGMVFGGAGAIFSKERGAGA